jgi:hypothetical protein
MSPQNPGDGESFSSYALIRVALFHVPLHALYTCRIQPQSSPSGTSLLPRISRSVPGQYRARFVRRIETEYKLLSVLQARRRTSSMDHCYGLESLKFQSNWDTLLDICTKARSGSGTSSRWSSKRCRLLNACIVLVDYG